MCIILFNKNNNKINAYGKYNYYGRLFLMFYVHTNM